MIFSIFRFFCTLRFQIYKYCPIITNHTSMGSYLFSFQMMYKSQFKKLTLMTGFVLQGHIRLSVFRCAVISRSRPRSQVRWRVCVAAAPPAGRTAGSAATAPVCVSFRSSGRAARVSTASPGRRSSPSSPRTSASSRLMCSSPPDASLS